MKTLVLTSAAAAAVIAVCSVTPLSAQGGGSGAASIPQLPFHLVENFFHYPAHSVIGRVSGIDVGPTGNIVSLNRGYDPRDFSLVAFGGGGGIHAVALATELGMRKVVIPYAADGS